jgi:hypothetical protein
MDDSHQTAGFLKKISLTFSIIGSDTSLERGKLPETMEFVFGIGINGLTPLEYMLAGKRVGDEVVLHLTPDDGDRQFAHLYRFLPRLPADAGPLDLKIVIADISEPTQREIVKAMAEVAACGSDCDCGCGSH